MSSKAKGHHPNHAGFRKISRFARNDSFATSASPLTLQSTQSYSRSLPGRNYTDLRIIDLHCYPNTEPWIKSQGPYVEALAKYWNRAWTWKDEARSSKNSSKLAWKPC